MESIYETFLLKAAIIVFIPIGLSIGILYFIQAYRLYQSSRGIDVEDKMRRVWLAIFILFTACTGIFIFIYYILRE